eukprot:4275-Heterococcus_DN1.PRE.3
MPLGGGVMYYHKQKPPGRLPKVVEEGLTAKDLLDDGVGKEPWQTLTVALLYLGCGGLDETHDTVQSMTNVQEANYIHALLHRREGERVGELSLRGWSNSCYWNDQTGSHPIQQQLQQKALETTVGKTYFGTVSCAFRHTSRATTSR